MTFDFCNIQRLINQLGGCDEFPAYPIAPKWAGDRLTQYGFDNGFDVHPPKCAGLYAVVCAKMGFDGKEFYHIGAEHILYIGVAKNIHKRVKSANHWPRKLNDRFGAYTRHLITNDYIAIEKSLIRTLHPWLNVIHNRKR